MYIKKGSHGEVLKHNMRGGDGMVSLYPAAQGEQLPASCRLFSRIELPTGASIGLHWHEGEAEMFYVLSGHPTLTDDGAEYTAQPGDCIVTRSGHSHAVRNNGGEPVELLACIAKD